MTAPHIVTVFGGTGFIGHALVRRLARSGAVVRVATRDMDKALPLKVAGDAGQIIPIFCRTQCDALVERAVSGADSVVNLIGILSRDGRDTFQSVHVETAARIARISRQGGAKRFVHVSALGADEGSKSQYSRSKASGEEAVRAFFPEATVLRPGIVFGPEDRFLCKFARLARFLPAMPLIGGGSTRFQPVYVGDVADAVVAALDRKDAEGRTYDLAGPTVYTFRQMLDMALGGKGKYVDIPWSLAKFLATFTGLLPNAPLTRDQVELLKTDNVLKRCGALTLHDLGIEPKALESFYGYANLQRK